MRCSTSTPIMTYASRRTTELPARYRIDSCFIAAYNFSPPPDRVEVGLRRPGAKRIIAGCLPRGLKNARDDAAAARRRHFRRRWPDAIPWRFSGFFAVRAQRFDFMKLNHTPALAPPTLFGAKDANRQFGSSTLPLRAFLEPPCLEPATR